MLLMHDGRDGGVRAGQTGQPHSGQSDHKQLRHPTVAKFDHDAPHAYMRECEYMRCNHMCQGAYVAQRISEMAA